MGTEQWALAGNGLINFELAANQERSNPSNVTCLSLITVLKEWVNIIVLLHNLLTGERVTHNFYALYAFSGVVCNNFV